MSFGDPQLLFGLLAVPLAVWGFFRLERRRARRAATWSSPSLLSNMVTSDPGRRRRIPAVLFLLGLTLLLVGFARPEASFNETKEGATIVLALDTSGSMAAKDVKPTRLRAADAALTEFVNKLPSKYRVALIVFTDHFALKVAPTYDRAELIRGLPLTTKQKPTALGEAIGGALTVAKRAVGPNRPGAPHPPAAILVLSDGGNNAGRLTPAKAAAQARKARIPVSTVSLGTLSGEVHQILKVGNKKYPEVLKAPVESATLRQVARASGGTFFQGHSAEQLKQVYKDLGSRLLHGKKRHEITVATTGAAFALILAGALLSGVWFRRLV